MGVSITFGELIEQGCWDEFCELKGYDVWIVNEGKADSSECVTLSFEDADKLGLHFRFTNH